MHGLQGGWAGFVRVRVRVLVLQETRCGQVRAHARCRACVSSTVEAIDLFARPVSFGAAMPAVREPQLVPRAGVCYEPFHPPLDVAVRWLTAAVVLKFREGDDGVVIPVEFAGQQIAGCAWGTTRGRVNA